MDHKSPISDATITRNVARQLSGCGLRSPCRIDVQTRNGEVTLSGAVQFVHQRNAAVQAIRTVEGVKRVVEKLKVTPPAKHQYAEPSPTPKPRPAEVPQDETATQTQPETTERQPDMVEETASLSSQPSANGQPAKSVVMDSADTSFELAGALPPEPRATGNMSHSRNGDSYTFECVSLEEAERLRAILATYVDWLKRNSWVGGAKPGGGMHRVTFHAKSVIEFLRQEGF